MAKRQISPVETKHIRLRLLEEKDLDQTLSWRNQDHIRRWFFHSEVILPEQHAAWFQKYRDRDDDFVFIIEERGRNNRPIGQAAIYNIDWERRQAEFGRLMIGVKDALGKGFALAATQAILQVAHNILNLKSVYLEVYKNNHKAIKIYKTVGFIVLDTATDILRMQNILGN